MGLAFSTLHATFVVVAATAIAIASALYAVGHFAINTDVDKLIATSNSPARQNQLAYEEAFPQRKILSVIEGPTSEQVDQATDRLADALRGQPDLFRSVERPDGGAFLQHNALMFLPAPDLNRVTGKLSAAGPMLGTLASDPTLRGVDDALALTLAVKAVAAVSMAKQ
jgi:uncharacterized protein